MTNRAQKVGLNADKDVDSVSPGRCTEALPKVLTELVSWRATKSILRLLMAPVDVNDAYRNVRVDSDKAHNFCDMVVDLVVVDFRLTFGWTGSPGYFGVMTSAEEHSNCNTHLSSAQLLPEGEKMMEHVNK